MAFAAPTDKTGRCIGQNFAGNQDEDIRSLLRDGDTGEKGSTGATCGSASKSGVGGQSPDNSLNDTTSNTDPSCLIHEGSRDRALRALRRDLENSRGLEKQGSHASGLERDRPLRTEPYRKAKRLRQIGKHRSLDEVSLGGSEATASGGPPSPLSGGGLSNSSRQDSLTELTCPPTGEQVPQLWLSDEDTDDRSYGDSSTTSSSFWSAPLYDKNKVPSILVSGISRELETNNGSGVITDNNLAVEMDREYVGSTVVHQPHYAGELISLLNIMRESGDLVNAKIYSGGQKVTGHKAILAAGSPYLANIMEGHSSTSFQKVEINTPDLRPELLGQLVDFIYTAKIGISSQNAQEMLQQAYNKKLFVGKSVELACSEYLMGQFSTEGGSETSSTTGRSSVFSLEEDGQSSSPESFFHDRNYPLDTLYVLNRQRKLKQFTDLVLHVEGNEFHCHRAILIAISPYFRAMLTSDMKECVEEEVTMHDIRADIFTILLDFVYTCRLYINEDNAQDIMELACFLQLLPAISACAQYFKDQLAISNCLGILGFAHMYNCSQLYDDAMDFALINFNEVTTSEEFQDMQPAILSALIADDRLNVKKEESVYEAVMVWLRENIEERLSQFPAILVNVRLPLIDPVYYREIVEPEVLLKMDHECVELVQMAINLRQISGKSKHLTDVRLKLRFSMKTQVMVIVGGYDDEQQWVRDVWCFNPTSDSWRALAPFPGRNRRFGCISLGDDIYVVGGQADHGDHMSETLSDVWRYDSITDTWSQVASMTKPRHGHGLCVVDGKIYAVGGKMGWAKRFNDIERYESSSNVWTCVTRIKGSYVEKPVCSSLDGKLYVNGYFYRDPDIMHCYTPADNSWEPMYSFKRMEGDGIENAVVLHDYIYFMVYRGYDNYVIIYNPSTGEHIKGSWMPDGKYLYSYGMTVIGDKIYIAGGSKLDASINVSHIQCYDPALNLWGVVGAIPYPLCEHGCVTIEKYIPNCE